MDLSALMGTILCGDSVQGISQKTGASANEVASVLRAALPQLLSGANQQSLNASTSESFTNALASHAQSDISNLSAFMNGVDMKDGAKIVAHLLGANNTETEKKVAKASGVSPAKTKLILAVAAPLLMSLMGKQTAAAQQQNSAASTSSLMSSLLGNADIGSLAAGLLGMNAGGAQNKKNDGIGLDDIAGLLGKLLK